MDKDAEAIQSVMASDDLYDVLAAERSLDEGQIRKCFLKRSVAVHPDKNKNELATTAFQKVAEAWAVLGDPVARADYDRGGMPAAPPSSGGLSADDAFAAFAAAYGATMAGNHGFAGNFAETVFWAQQLVEARGGLEPADAGMIIRGGLALSSGIRTAGTAADALGFKGAADGSRAAANFVQTAASVAAVSVVAAKIPAVQEKLTTTKAAVTEKLNSFSSVVQKAREKSRENVQSMGESVEGVANSETVQSIMTGVSSWLGTARAYVAEQKGKTEESGSLPPELKKSKTNDQQGDPVD